MVVVVESVDAEEIGSGRHGPGYSFPESFAKFDQKLLDFSMHVAALADDELRFDDGDHTLAAGCLP